MLKKIIMPLVMTAVILGGSFANASAASVKNIIIPGGTMGGSMYTTATMISNIASSKIPGLSVSARASGTKENIFQLMGGEVEFAMASGFDYFVATEGQMPKDAKDINTCMVMYRQYAPIIVAGNSPINSTPDLKGKRINMMDRRTGSYTVNTHLLEVIGLTEKEIIPFYMSSSEGATTLTEGRIDAAFYLTALPAPAMSVITSSRNGGKILPLTDAQLDALVKKYSFYSITTTPPEMLPNLGVSAPIKLPTYNAELLVGANVPEELVYNLVKAVMENKDMLVAGMASLNEVSPAHTVKEATMPLHPGAIRYFKEIGAM